MYLDEEGVLKIARPGRRPNDLPGGRKDFPEGPQSWEKLYRLTILALFYTFLKWTVSKTVLKDFSNTLREPLMTASGSLYIVSHKNGYFWICLCQTLCKTFLEVLDIFLKYRESFEKSLMLFHRYFSAIF